MCAVGKGICGRKERREFFEVRSPAMGTWGLVIIFGHADFRDFAAVGAFVVEERHIGIRFFYGDKKLPGGRFIPARQL